MPYVLGIHLGATASSAATVHRDGRQWGSPVPVPLGNVGHAVPSVLCKVQDGSFVGGEAAQRQSLTHHEWVACGFVRDVGDVVPQLVGNDFVTPHHLAAVLVEWLADAVAHRHGQPPDHIAVAHPVAWGLHRCHLVRQALAQLGLEEVTMVPEPVAVGTDFVAKQGVAEGAMLAVGIIGGSGFDATVLARRADGCELVGSGLIVDHPCGRDLDDEVFEHARAELADSLGDLDPADPADRSVLAELRQQCVRLKETLSYQPESRISLELPAGACHWGLARSRYERWARPHLDRVPELLSQVVQAASVRTEELAAVVLAGGVARTPVLAGLVAHRMEVRPKVDTAPELVAARGAALVAVDAVATRSDRSRLAESELDTAGSAAETTVFAPVVRNSGGVLFDPLPEETKIPRPVVDVRELTLPEPSPDRQRTLRILKITAAAALILFGLVMTFVQQGPSGGQGGVGGLHQPR